jgi:hypothetical protein
LPKLVRRIFIKFDSSGLATRGVRAEELLDNELFSRQCDRQLCRPRKAASCDHIVGKVRDHLASVTANGKLAQAELKEIVQTAERRRRFGIL